ncbi:TonB-dependent receptor [Thauera sp.]|uniref:TonB-dependent receptor plug domain-containing protein n=1 Tax=Thauera sp. TaxID=1905334 RepID=UPI002C3D98F6|nr:TonB-dependent receptor [Thauera sp.]HRO36753.1 TonB-dependent receptor [Thauera sp.]
MLYHPCLIFLFGQASRRQPAREPDFLELSIVLRLRPLAVAVLGLFALPVPSLVHAETVLGAQTVTAKGYAADTFETPQAVEILQAPAAGGTVAGGLLRGKPGLAAQSDGAWGQNPVLRGLKKESVVVMVDGVRMNSAQPQGAIASFLDLGLLERAEVVKGPGSVLYGSGAMGGVVNLITPDVGFTAEERLGGRIGARFSSVDKGVSGAALLTRSSANSALVLGVAGRDVDDYRSPDGREDRTGYQSDTLLAKYKHKLNEDLSLRVNLQRHEDEDVWYPGSARVQAVQGPNGRVPLGLVTIHSPEQRRELYELGVDAKLAEGTLSAEIYRQEVFRQIRARSDRFAKDYVRNDVSFVTDGAKAKYLFPVGENHLLTVGMDFWRMRGDPERYMDNNAALDNNVRNDPFNKGVIESSGVFVQDEFAIGETRIVAGARFDRVSGEAARKGMTQTSGLDNTDNNLSWSLGAIQPLDESLSAYANLGRAYRAPDMRERFEDSARGDGYYHVGNPQLDAEVSTSFELGLKQADAALQYQVAAFYTRIEDYIAGRVTGQIAPSGARIKLTENLDKVTLYGIEGSASVPVGAFVADAGFTWLRGKNHQDDEPLFQMPAPELTLGIGQPAERGFWWRAQLRAVAEQDRIAAKFSNGTENPTAGFVTADAEFGWRFGKVGAFESAGLAVQLSNLADKRYHEHQTEGVSGNELAAPGRGIALSLNGSF